MRHSEAKIGAVAILATRSTAHLNDLRVTTQTTNILSNAARSAVFGCYPESLDWMVSRLRH